MLVILYISNGLIQITIWTNSRSYKTILDFTEEFFDYWNTILADDYSFHLIWLYEIVPLVLSNFRYSESFRRICIQYFPY